MLVCPGRPSRLGRASHSIGIGMYLRCPIDGYRSPSWQPEKCSIENVEQILKSSISSLMVSGFPSRSFLISWKNKKSTSEPQTWPEIVSVFVLMIDRMSWIPAIYNKPSEGCCIAWPASQVSIFRNRKMTMLCPLWKVFNNFLEPKGR